jgi:hypothetical protein
MSRRSKSPEASSQNLEVKCFRNFSLDSLQGDGKSNLKRDKNPSQARSRRFDRYCS